MFRPPSVREKGFARDLGRDYNGLIAGVDPVAVETIALRIILAAGWTDGLLIKA